MKRLAMPLLAVLACASVPAPAVLPPRLAFDLGALDDRPAGFDAAAIDDRALAKMVGTGGGLSEDMPEIVSAQRQFDRSMIAGSTSDTIDGWWSQVGADLIAANLL